MRFKLVVLLSLSLGLFSSCSNDVEEKVWYGNLDKRLEEDWSYISSEEFEENDGKTITLEGLAVNAKPNSYLYMNYHVYINSDSVFFWQPYLVGKKIRIKGTARVVKERDLKYAQIKKYRKRYFFDIESYSIID